MLTTRRSTALQIARTCNESVHSQHSSGRVRPVLCAVAAPAEALPGVASGETNGFAVAISESTTMRSPIPWAAGRPISVRTLIGEVVASHVSVLAIESFTHEANDQPYPQGCDKCADNEADDNNRDVDHQSEYADAQADAQDGCGGVHFAKLAIQTLVGRWSFRERPACITIRTRRPIARHGRASSPHTARADESSLLRRQAPWRSATQEEPEAE
jgi:hypothetical protein